jgi:Caspase domain
MLNRCAVVIGVSKTGGLPSLASPIPGAKLVAQLFRDNGYDVECVTDEAGPVTASRITAAISGYINKQPVKGYHLMVVYFSGHGYWKNQGDLWLLSNAPVDPDEAVSLLECGDLAQDCGIDTVVLISDACRSTPQGKVASRVRGSLVFPNRAGVPGKRSKVDRLLAAREGTPAYEVKIGKNGELESVFTHCFLKAFKKPDSNMVASVAEDGLTIYVVPNRRLDKFLLRELEEVLAKVNIKLSQEPVIDIVSDDHVYMARVEALQGATRGPDVLPLQPAAPPQLELAPADVVIAKTFDLKIDTGGTTLVLPPTSPTAGTAIITTRSLIRHALDASLADDAKPIGDNELDEIRDAMTHGGQERRSRETLFLRELGENIAAGGFGPVSAEVKEFESGTGFTVAGATIDGVLMTGSHYGNNRIEVLERGGDKKTGIIRVWLDNRPAASVLLVLSNGSGVPLAALQGYIGHILIRDGRVRNINYIPINPTHGQPVKPWRWIFYLQNKSQLERLRALAASAITGNSFRIGDAKRADQLASIIRDVKAIDPMLGLFATYAYLEAGHDQELQSVRQYMSGDLDAELFDVAMLGRPNDLPPNFPPLRRVPFCPVLTQGWNYFRSRNIQLPSQLTEAQDQLVPGPFTMFEPKIAKTIFYAVSRGELDEV